MGNTTNNHHRDRPMINCTMVVASWAGKTYVKATQVASSSILSKTMGMPSAYPKKSYKCIHVESCSWKNQWINIIKNGCEKKQSARSKSNGKISKPRFRRDFFFIHSKNRTQIETRGMWSVRWAVFNSRQKGTLRLAAKFWILLTAAWWFSQFYSFFW